MGLKWLVEFPQAREAPRHIREALRRLDPTAEVVYLGPRRWLVGRVRPTTESVAIARQMLAHAADVRSVWARNSAARRARVALAMLGLQGFRPVAEYQMTDLDDRVVREFQESQWRLRHTSDAELFREMDAEQESRRAEAEAEMRDRHRGADAYRTAFTSNFGRAVRSVTNTDVDTRSSARTRVYPSNAA